MSFAQEEIAFIKSQRLARIATVDDDGQPDVVPVGFEFDGTYFNIGGLRPANTRRHHNVAAGNHKVALVIDDVASAEPWTPRFLRIRREPELAAAPVAAPAQVELPASPDEPHPEQPRED